MILVIKIIVKVITIIIIIIIIIMIMITCLSILVKTSFRVGKKDAIFQLQLLFLF